MDPRQALEEFIVNNSDLERLEDMVAGFNVFKILGIERSESRHSAFLAWLLDPNENHGLGDYFLRGFLWLVTANPKAHQIGSITPFDVDRWALGDTMVDTERHRIDILLTNNEEKFVCVIENKLFAGEHGDQLTRYRKTVEREYPTLTPLFVLLTVDGESPNGDDDSAYYIPISHAETANLIEKAVVTRSSRIGVDVQSVMRQYVASLRRYVLVDSEVQKLARQIYYKHKDALDLIVDAKPDIRNEVRDLIESVVKDYPDLQPDISKKIFIRYCPIEWDQISDLSKGHGWTETGRMLLFEFRNDKTLSLHLVLGPGPANVRNRVYEIAKDKQTIFNKTPNKLGSKWNSLYRKQILNSSEYDQPNVDVLRDQVKKVVSQFMSEEFEPLVRAINLGFDAENAHLGTGSNGSRVQRLLV